MAWRLVWKRPPNQCIAVTPGKTTMGVMVVDPPQTAAPPTPTPTPRVVVTPVGKPVPKAMEARLLAAVLAAVQGVVLVPEPRPNNRPER